MNIKEQAIAYQQFFYQSEAGRAYMDMLRSTEESHLMKAQREQSLSELSISYGNKEALLHIETLISQVAGQSKE